MKSIKGTDQYKVINSSNSSLKIESNSGDFKKQAELGKSSNFQEKWLQLYP